MFVIVIIEIVKTLKNIRKLKPDYVLLKLTINIYIIMFFLALFVGYTIHDLTFPKPTIYRVLILAFLFKLTPQNYKLLLSNKI